jgi:hypothetical protein
MYAFIPTKLGKKNETETEIPQKHPFLSQSWFMDIP